MPKPEASLTRRLDAWAEAALAKRFPMLAKLHPRTLYRYEALTVTVAYLVLRIPRWGPRGLRVFLGVMATWLLGVLVVDQVATRVRRRRAKISQTRTSQPIGSAATFQKDPE